MSPPPKPGDIEGAVRRLMRVIRLIGSRSFPPEEGMLRDMCERHVLRSCHPAGGMRQLAAIAASDDRRAIVRQIKAPTLVIHGDEDPLVRPAAGADTAQTIRDGGGDARLAIFKGMGHDFPAPLIPQIADEIAVHCRAHPP
jgi:proline iminopeptidase